MLTPIGGLIGFNIIFNILDGLDRLNSSKYDPREFIVETEYQDKFVVVEELMYTFPERSYNYQIYSVNNESKRKFVAEVSGEGFWGIEGIYNNQDLRGYLVNYYVLYKKKGQEHFKVIHQYDLNNLDVKEYEYLIPIVKQLFNEDWGWKELTAEFLVKANDEETIKTLKRYAEGKFTPDELGSIDWPYTQEEIQKFSKDILSKYGVE